ncbi:MAG: uroporphyrinogen decarboxylase family protein [Phycisphaeraceae bacterium]
MSGPNETLTPRQRWLALLEGKPVDRIPTDYWATREFDAKLKAHVGVADDEALWDQLEIDHPRQLRLGMVSPDPPADPDVDLWGVRHQRITYAGGVYLEVAPGGRPLANATSAAEIRSYPLPSPDIYDYESIRRAAAEDDGYRPVRAGGFEPFLLYCKLRGLEQGFEDLLVNPEIADALLGRIFEFFYEHNRLILEAGGGKIDLFYLAEDLGSQHGPLMSLETYRRFLLPNQIRMADLARSYGAHVFYHTDGAARPFLPDLIDKVGIEILNPIQWRCSGMERDALARDFGDRVVFHGAVDNQYTLAFGTPEEVAHEVETNARLFQDARWICAPCHNIQPVSPPENVVTMYETVRQLEPHGALKGPSV